MMRVSPINRLSDDSISLSCLAFGSSSGVMVERPRKQGIFIRRVRGNLLGGILCSQIISHTLPFSLLL